MNQILENLKEVFLKKTYAISIIIQTIIYYILFELITESELFIGNYGMVQFYILIVSHILISFLFALFISLTIYKIKYFSPPSKSTQASSFLGAFFGILVTGCPSCSITLASYIGLAGMVSLLPYHGLELKIISIIFLGFACYSTARNLKTCKLTLKKK